MRPLALPLSLTPLTAVLMIAASLGASFCRGSSDRLSSPESSSAQPAAAPTPAPGEPKAIEGLYTHCGGVAVFQPCDGSAPLAVDGLAAAEAEYVRLGRTSCQATFARLTARPPTWMTPGFLDRLPSSFKLGPSPQAVSVQSVILLESAPADTPCRTRPSVIDQLRPLVEKAMPGMAHYREKVGLIGAGGYTVECTARAVDWFIKDWRDIEYSSPSSAKVYVRIVGECKGSAAHIPATAEDALYLEKGATGWGLAGARRSLEQK